MDPISEKEQATFMAANSQSTTTKAKIEEAAAIHKLLKIVDENDIIIDDHLRSTILGQAGDRMYTSHDADESVRRSSSSSSSMLSSSSSSFMSKRRLSRSSLRRGGNSSSSSSSRGDESHSRRQLGSILFHRRNNKHQRHSSSSVESAEVSSETDSSISMGIRL